MSASTGNRFVESFGGDFLRRFLFCASAVVVIAAVFLFFSAPPAEATTFVSGTISQNTT